MKFPSAIIITLLLSCSFFKIKAQTCTRYVLYKDDFGGGPNAPEIGQPLPDGITDYQFTTSTVEDGFYAIRKGPGSHYASWLQGTDHTGNDGYMMVVNASYDAGLFYQKTITGLCHGGTFYFSAYIANLIRKGRNDPLDPNIQFEIINPETNTVIKTMETGLLPRYSTLTWKRYEIEFELPSNVSSVILKMFNHQKGGGGNDLVLDDISFEICGPPINTMTTGLYKNSQNACVGNAIQIQASIPSGSFKSPQYQWQFATDTMQWKNVSGARQLTYDISSAQASDSGWYRLLAAEYGDLQSKNCRIASNAIPIHIYQGFNPEIVTNSPVCEGDSLFLKGPEGLTYNWIGPHHFTSQSQTIQFSSAQTNLNGTYQLKTINPGGCERTNSHQVAVQENDLSISLGTDTILCEGTSSMLDASNPGATYLWNTGAITPNILVDTGGFYKVKVSKAACSLSDSIYIKSVKTPKVNLGVDTIVCFGIPYVLNAAYQDVKDYRWQDGSIDSVYAVTNTGMYAVTLQNICGQASDQIQITVEPCSDRLIFPTAFSPNFDGENDVFKPRVLFRLSHYSLEVYNRWGQKVFHSKDPFNGWNGYVNGHTAPTGTYVWIAKYIRMQDHQNVAQKGVITLIR